MDIGVLTTGFVIVLFLVGKCKGTDGSDADCSPDSQFRRTTKQTWPVASRCEGMPILLSGQWVGVVAAYSSRVCKSRATAGSGSD